MVAKLTRQTCKTAMKLHLAVENCAICSSRSRWLVLKLLDTPLQAQSLGFLFRVLPCQDAPTQTHLFRPWTEHTSALHSLAA